MVQTYISVAIHVRCLLTLNAFTMFFALFDVTSPITDTQLQPYLLRHPTVSQLFVKQLVYALSACVFQSSYFLLEYISSLVWCCVMVLYTSTLRGTSADSMRRMHFAGICAGRRDPEARARQRPTAAAAGCMHCHHGATDERTE